MKKTIILSIAFLGLCLFSVAHPIHQETAQAIAVKFMGVKDLQLATTFRTDKGIAALYVFNTTDGFVIISADDCETPIIGYSFEGCFDPNNIPIQMEDYLNDFVSRIQYGIENHTVADEATAKQWALVKTSGQLNDCKEAKSVEPLLTDKWHQGCLYNSLCPAFEDAPCGHAEVGCVAMAMAQIIHYWRYPNTGWGSHSYSNAGVTLSADFGNTTYDWENMPDSLSENSNQTEIEAVATLLYHCGVAVEMRYGPYGSNSSSGSIPEALLRYFSYSKHIHREKRADFNDEEWMTLLKNCLDLQRPVQYSGFGVGAGHAFVCDGYDENDLLHFNWGWGGSANGYFALGNLNPNGYNLSSSNFAIFDIIPQYEPYVVTATAYPSIAGTIQGSGEYHHGDSCTLTAIPKENSMFLCWKQGGITVSNNASYTFEVVEDFDDIEAYFSYLDVSQISACYAPDMNDPNSPCVNLTWTHTDTDWVLLKQFETHEEGGGVATDGEHIYVTYGDWNLPPFAFGKYTMEGDLVEQFNLGNNFNALCLAYDGTSFYCNCSRSGLKVIYQVDLYNKIVIDSTDMGVWFGTLTYDPEYDGFWLGHNNQMLLYSRQGLAITSSPMAPDYIFGTGYYTSKDGNPHLFLSRESGVYDYDITNNVILDRPLLSPGWDYTYGVGACTGKYDGKDAMFIAIDYSIRIYEIKSQPTQIVGYRIYRADSEGQTVMLADNVGGSSYLDTTWNDAQSGVYRFGISEKYANGNASEIIWSDTIVKTDIGFNEFTEDQAEQPVQKVLENGQIVIIKDGKRFTVTGQQLN